MSLFLYYDVILSVSQNSFGRNLMLCPTVRPPMRVHLVITGCLSGYIQLNESMRGYNLAWNRFVFIEPTRPTRLSTRDHQTSFQHLFRHISESPIQN